MTLRGRTVIAALWFAYSVGYVVGETRTAARFQKVIGDEFVRNLREPVIPWRYHDPARGRVYRTHRRRGLTIHRYDDDGQEVVVARAWWRRWR